jgi:deferrochelatase/peroxidase EfeB
VIPENAHVRLATAATNDGARILRRSYSYNDGVNFTAERWPPWRQGMEYDAGLLFVCYQNDPRTGFIKIFERLSKFDMMNQFVTNTGGGLFACPGGVAPGEFVGQRLFERA